MPIYAYRCTSCGHAKDVLQKISDPLLTDCPACGAATFVKQVTAAGFQLKGSGWYVTDFRGGNGGKPEGDGQAAGDKGADKAVDKSAEKGDSSKVAEKAAASPPAPAAAPAPVASPSSPAPAPSGPATPASGG